MVEIILNEREGVTRSVDAIVYDIVDESSRVGTTLEMKENETYSTSVDERLGGLELSEVK